jgi:FkbM family methyltransferase
MLLERITRFVSKPVAEKRTTLRFLTHKAIAKVPFLPVRARVAMSPADTIHYWWSYVPMSFHAERSLLDYWGDDLEEVRFVWEFLKPGMVFFDIGAHHGFYSLLAAKRVSQRGRIVAFEPSVRERKRFELHMKWNGVEGVCLEPYAVSSATEPLRFYSVDSDFTMMNSLKRPRVEEAVHENIVEAVSLDDYVSKNDIPRIDLIKIDVEGGELEAFRGAERVLQAIRPVIVCEVLDWVTEAWGYAARNKIAFLKERGYDWFDFNADGRLSEHQERDGYPEPRNYLAIPREKVALVFQGRRA